MQPLLLWVLGLAIIFDFLAGVHGAGNVVSTMISSRALRPSAALTLGAAAEFLGPFLFGTAVARTVGGQIIRPDIITLEMLIAALLAAIAWNGFTWFLGIPSSSSHGLFGGLIGAGLVGAGMRALQWSGLIKVGVGLFLSPLVGFGLGLLLLRLIYGLTAQATPRVNEFFRRGQLLTVAALGLSHGANDAQKAMGVIVLALVLSGSLPGFEIPLWVVALCAGVMALGTALGGRRMIRTVGGRFYKVRPVHSFAAQSSSALVMVAASLLGWPVSTAHVVSSAIIGVGSAEGVNRVRWGLAGDILAAWLWTIPATAALSATLYWLLQRIQI
ncbi:MAG: anion permease [Bacteroidota bacterium]